MSEESRSQTDPLRAWMDLGDRTPLLRADERAAAASLLRLLDEQEANFPEIDGERIARGAWALARARKEGASASAMAWLRARPDQARLAVVLCLLAVSWNPSPETYPPEPDAIEELLSIYGELPRDPVVENTLLVVLVAASRAALPLELAARIRGFIEQARNDPSRPPEIDAILDQFLNGQRGRL